MKPLTLNIMTISTSWSLVKLVIWFVIAYMPSASRSATMGNLLLWSSSSPALSSTQTLQQILSFSTCSLVLPTLANHRLHVRLCYMHNGLLSFPPDVIRPRVTVSHISHSHLPYQPYGRTNAYLHPYVPSTVSPEFLTSTHCFNSQYLVLLMLCN